MKTSVISSLREETPNERISLEIPLPPNVIAPSNAGFSWSCYVKKPNGSPAFNIRRISLGYKNSKLLLEGDSQVIFVCFNKTCAPAAGVNEERAKLCEKYGIPYITTGLRSLPNGCGSSRLVSFASTWWAEALK